jgi:hypothetical protein
MQAAGFGLLEGESTRSAPHRAAAALRWANGSTATIEAAPAERATWITIRPIGPQPTTATVLP